MRVFATPTNKRGSINYNREDLRENYSQRANEGARGHRAGTPIIIGESLVPLEQFCVGLYCLISSQLP